MLVSNSDEIIKIANPTKQGSFFEIKPHGLLSRKDSHFDGGWEKLVVKTLGHGVASYNELVAYDMSDEDFYAKYASVQVEETKSEPEVQVKTEEVPPSGGESSSNSTVDALKGGSSPKTE